MIQLTLAVLAFVGGHFLLSSPPVRGPVVARVGEPAFSGIYSALMLAAFVWMVRAFRAASFIPLWSAPPDARVIPAIVMPFACLLLVGSLTVRNPTMIMQSIAARGDPAPGLLKVTRYPMPKTRSFYPLARARSGCFGAMRTVLTYLTVPAGAPGSPILVPFA